MCNLGVAADVDPPVMYCYGMRDCEPLAVYIAAKAEKTPPQYKRCLMKNARAPCADWPPPTLYTIVSIDKASSTSLVPHKLSHAFSSPSRLLPLAWRRPAPCVSSCALANSRRQAGKRRKKEDPGEAPWKQQLMPCPGQRSARAWPSSPLPSAWWRWPWCCCSSAAGRGAAATSAGRT